MSSTILHVVYKVKWAGYLALIISVSFFPINDIGSIYFLSKMSHKLYSYLAKAHKGRGDSSEPSEANLSS